MTTKSYFAKKDTRYNVMHLLRIDEIQHRDKAGNVLWEDKNIHNVFHLDGEQFILNVIFNTSSGLTVPSSFYLGLDNRSAIAITDGLANLNQEPTQFGYTRQPVSSANGFQITQDNLGNFRATSQIVTFSATGGTWGPITNLFLASVPNNTGYLLSSAPLVSSKSVANGQSLTVRISLGLVNF